jgi:Cd2+/Zn2+-exporting ATPase
MKALLYMLPYLVIGYNVLYTAARNIINGQIFDEKLLMTLATIGAFVIGEYPEAVMVMTFFMVGELFEKLAVGKSRKSINELMNIVPDSANLLTDGVIKKVSPDEVSKGDIIVICPGEKIPLDGVIIEGETYVDTTALTGESVPRGLKVGDAVISGCVNMQGLIHVKVENEFYESTAAKILELVESSTLKKAKTEAFSKSIFSITPS